MARTIVQASTQYFYKTGGLSTPLTFPFTWHCLFRADNLTLAPWFMNFANTVDTAWVGMSSSAAGAPRVHHYDGTFNGQAIGSNGLVTTGRWNSIGGRFISIASRDIWHDGIQRASDTTSVSGGLSGMTVMGVGAYQGGITSNWLAGRIAEVCIWNGQLSNDEMEALGGGGVAGGPYYSPLMIRPELIANYWQMLDPGEGLTIAKDRGPRFFHLTGSNSPAYSEHPPMIYPL